MSLEKVPTSIVSPERIAQLEQIIFHKVCPLIVIDSRIPEHIPLLGMYNHDGTTDFYKCAVDGGLARGGHKSNMGALTPCSEEFSKTCSLYQNQISSGEE